MEREKGSHGTPGISQDTLPLLTGMEASSPKVRAKRHSHLINQGWSVGVQQVIAVSHSRLGTGEIRGDSLMKPISLLALASSLSY